MSNLWFRSEDVVVDEKKPLQIFGGCWREVPFSTSLEAYAFCAQHRELLGGADYVNFFRLIGDRLLTVIVKDGRPIEKIYGGYELVYIIHSGGIPRFFAPEKKK